MMKSVIKYNGQLYLVKNGLSVEVYDCDLLCDNVIDSDRLLIQNMSLYNYSKNTYGRHSTYVHSYSLQ